jgi:hypothetical protein
MIRVSSLLPLAINLLLLSSTAAEAGTVQLTVRGGRVWLVTTDATVREILAEWERVGRTQIVNGENVNSGPPLTIQLAEAPEQQALDMILRSVAGYVAVTRSVPVADVSQFGRIVILPTSTHPDALRAGGAPPPVTQPGATPTSMQPAPERPVAFRRRSAPGASEGSSAVMNGSQRLVGPDGRAVSDDQEDGVARQPAVQRVVPLPPGFSAPPQVPAPQQGATGLPANRAGTGVPVGVPVPGMIVPTPGSQPQAGQPAATISPGASPRSSPRTQPGQVAQPGRSSPPVTAQPGQAARPPER